MPVDSSDLENLENRVQKTLQMGLGEAIQRLMRVELLIQTGLTAVPEATRAERLLIIEALNTMKLDLGFDCNSDGVPDTVDIFAKSAETSCCRILPNPMTAPKRRNYVSSRRKGD